LKQLVEVLPELSKEAILERDTIEFRQNMPKTRRAWELVEVGVDISFEQNHSGAEWIQRLKKAKPVKLSRSALETLAIVA